MHEHDPISSPPLRPRWTEDRVERLLLALFSEQSAAVASPSPIRRKQAPRSRLLVAVVAASLAVIAPILSAPVEDDVTLESSRIARWIGPNSRLGGPSVDLASNTEVELPADENEAPSVGESDETAEAPVATESEDSAST